MSPQPTYTAAQLRRARAMGGDLVEALARVVSDDHATAQAFSADLGPEVAPDRLAQWVANAPAVVPAATRGKWYPYKSKLERDYAEHLERVRVAGWIVSWSYEAITLKLAEGTRFTPDFLVVTVRGAVELHETKGYMREAARVRLNVAARMYPMFAFRLVRRGKRGYGSQFEVSEVRG